MSTKLLALLPEISILCVISILAFRTLFEHRSQSPRSLRSALVLMPFGFIASLLTINLNASILGGVYTVDALTQAVKLVLSGSAVFSTYFTKGSFGIPSSRKTEFLIFINTALLGMMIMVSAKEFLTFFIGLELSAYSFYVMVPARHASISSESGIKYLILGAIASTFTLIGFSFLLPFSDSTFISDLFNCIYLYPDEPIVLISIFLLFIAIIVKLSCVPFHFWAPDVYQAAPIPVASFVTTASKFIATIIFIQWLQLSSNLQAWAIALPAIAFLSMIVGNTAALLQIDLKRLFAYSSIAQAGYILVGLTSLSPFGFKSCLFYAVVYLVANLGIFLILSRIGQVKKTDNPTIDDLNGLSTNSPTLSFLLLVSVLSLAGIPPLAGFAGKWFLFLAAVEEGFIVLAFFGVVNSVISLYYYLILVKHAFVDAGTSNTNIKLTPTQIISAASILITLIAIGLYPSLLLKFINFVL